MYLETPGNGNFVGLSGLRLRGSSLASFLHERKFSDIAVTRWPKATQDGKGALQ